MLSTRVEFDALGAVGSHQLLGSSEMRIAIQFFSPATGHATLANDPVAADGAGMVLTAGMQPVLLHQNSHGDIVHRPWYVLYSAGATPVGYMQIMR